MSKITVYNTATRETFRENCDFSSFFNEKTAMVTLWRLGLQAIDTPLNPRFFIWRRNRAVHLFTERIEKARSRCSEWWNIMENSCCFPAREFFLPTVYRLMPRPQGTAWWRSGLRTKNPIIWLRFIFVNPKKRRKALGRRCMKKSRWRQRRSQFFFIVGKPTVPILMPNQPVDPRYA